MFSKIFSTLAPINITNTAWKNIDRMLRNSDSFAVFFSAIREENNEISYKLKPITKNHFYSYYNEHSPLTILQNSNLNCVLVDPYMDNTLYNITIDYTDTDISDNSVKKKFIVKDYLKCK